jgi:proteasome lid subunit RPN8/RPN11
MATRVTRAWIRPEALRALLDAYASAEGREPCGALLGTVAPPHVRVEGAVALENVHPLGDRAFRVAPEALLHVVRHARAAGTSVVGIWHGHLEGRSTPGREDVASHVEAGDLAPALLVVLGRGLGPAPVVSAWARGKRGFYRVTLAVT